MGIIIDLSGQRFGRLVTIAIVPNRKPTHWKCRCDCGTICVVSRLMLRCGGTKSCGCFRREVTARLKYKHGMGREGAHSTPEHRVWKGMKQRCTDPNARNWKHYGGRGITICDRWLKSFEAFYADMGPKPRDASDDRRRRDLYSIERIDNNGPYSPENCRWATQNEQMLNRHR